MMAGTQSFLSPAVPPTPRMSVGGVPEVCLQCLLKHEGGRLCLTSSAVPAPELHGRPLEQAT